MEHVNIQFVETLGFSEAYIMTEELNFGRLIVAAVENFMLLQKKIFHENRIAHARTKLKLRFR